MADQFLGEIRIVPFNFAPYGWALCNGQLMSIPQNTALFSLLGTNYGGDGRTTFGLPNLQGSAPLAWGSGSGLTPRDIGETGGNTAVSLLMTAIPAHAHTAQNAVASTSGTPGPTVVFGGGGRGKEPAYAPASPQNTVQMSAQAVGMAGGGQAHNNLPPYLTLTFVIALQGIFPSRS
jgi:microcystin-dependent protein